MLRSTASKVMWVGRATVFLVGLSVILALVFGAASTALGADLDNLILGKAKNTATKLTGLVGSATSAMFQVTNSNTADTTGKAAAIGATTKNASSPALKATNSGGGPALGLNVASGKAPMTVNSGVKVTDLNADRIDDREASSFADGVNGVAIDADQLDGKDSTQFLGANAKANDADNLDGKDSGEFATQAGLDAEANTRASADNSLGTRATNLETKMSVFNAAQVIDSFGTLPKQGTYTSKGGTLIISAAGSGYRNSTTNAGLIGMQVKVDGVVRGQATLYTNERSSHKAFVDDYIVVKGLAAGSHTIVLERLFDTTWCGGPTELENDFCTLTDNSDSFRVTVVEIPA